MPIKSMYINLAKIFLMVCVICKPSINVAQILVNRGQDIVISQGSLLTIVGDLNNQGEINNRGEIQISGDWINQAGYTGDIGSVVLNGTGDQRIDNNQKEIFILEIDGGGNKILVNDLLISPNGRLNLNDGIIQYNGEYELVISENVSVEGGNMRSYVNGKLFHSGTGYKFFPIGKDGFYRPVELENVSGDQPVIGMEVFHGNENTSFDEDLESVSTVRYWELTHKTNPAVFEGSTISLSVGEDEPFMRIDEMVVTESDQPGGTFKNLGQSSYKGDKINGQVYSEMEIGQRFFALGRSMEIMLNNLLFVPNAFSPEASNPDERTIKVYGNEISENNFSFKIFDRWGNLIFQTNSFHEANRFGWSVRNTLELDGLVSFKYTLQGQFNNGNTFRRAGTIKLIK